MNVNYWLKLFSGNTSLLKASIGGHLLVVQYLLKEAGADISERNNYGN